MTFATEPTVDGPPPARAAATVLLLRDGDRGVEVLMLRRHAAVEFAGDAWVFPGGAVDPADRTLDPARWHGIDPAALADRFDATAAEVLGFHVAAVRETFEESGLLLAHHADGVPVLRAADRALRARVAGAGFHAWLAAQRLVCDLACLAYLSRWVTPVQSAKRFDACFFAALAPQGQVADHDRSETTDRRWVTAGDALEAHRRAQWSMMYPTRLTLGDLAAYERAGDVVAAARAQQRVRRIQPHAEPTGEGTRLIHPDEPDYPHHLYSEERAT